MSIKKLTSILTLPTAPVETGQLEEWLAIERKLEIVLPMDYKDYVSAFGTGYIGEFIWIFNPFAQKNSLNFMQQIRIRLDALKEIEQQIPTDVPFKLFPEKGGLLPCGATGNGDCLFWLTEGDPDKWPILINESRGPDWARFDMRLTDFLTGILKREIVCNIFPPDFPGETVAFASRS
jgi:hypothetical protein